MKMKLLVSCFALAFTSKQNKHFAENGGNFEENVGGNGAEESIFVKIQKDEHAKINKTEASSKYIGVSYNAKYRNWSARRYSRHEKKMICNGSYKNEETAAHASDTLGRKLLANGEQGRKLNFPDDETEVYPEEKTTSSQYIGVSYVENRSKWRANRYSKHEKKMVGNGYYESEEKTAHASDTLARKLMANGKQNYKLNFSDDDAEVYPEEKETSSQYIGVSYNVNALKWLAQRRSKHEKKDVSNGHYESEETAAHASDTLARKLMAKGEQNHKLNFPEDDNEVHLKERQRKRKRPDHKGDFGHPQNN